VSDARFLNHVVGAAIRPHEADVLAIASRGEVVVAVFKPAEEVRATLTTMGWEGQPVFGVSREVAARHFPDAAEWLAKPGAVHVLVALDTGTVQVDFDPTARRYSVRPRLGCSHVELTRKD
jgi:hypothetical protein